VTANPPIKLISPREPKEDAACISAAVVDAVFSVDVALGESGSPKIMKSLIPFLEYLNLEVKIKITQMIGIISKISLIMLYIIAAHPQPVE